MHPAPPRSTTRLLNIRPARSATRRSTVQMSTTHCSNRGGVMNFSDLLRVKGSRIADCESVASFGNENASRLRWRALSLSFALTMFCVGSTMAQTQQPDQTLTKTAEESAGKTSGNYNIQQTVEFGYRDSMIGGNLNNYNTFENLSSGFRLLDYTVDMRSI